MEEKRETKSVHRIIPCPDYDVTGVESWLSYMAEQGYILRDGGVFRGIAAFDSCEPEKVRYRLQPAQKGFVLYDNDGPDDDAVELNSAFGWKYVAKYGSFHIYRAEDTEVREMDTDPEVQAMAMNALHKSQGFNIIWMSIWINSISGSYLYKSAVSIDGKQRKPDKYCSRIVCDHIYSDRSG